MSRCLRAGVHDVAQSLTRKRVVLISRKAIPIFANCALSGDCWILSGTHLAEDIGARIIFHQRSTKDCLALSIDHELNRPRKL
jgi:hypothetical protein